LEGKLIPEWQDQCKNINDQGQVVLAQIKNLQIEAQNLQSTAEEQAKSLNSIIGQLQSQISAFQAISAAIDMSSSQVY